MKKVDSRRLLAFILSFTMMLSMMLVFTVAGSAEGAEKVYTLDCKDLSLFDVGKRDNGDYEFAGTDNHFTIHYSVKTKVEDAKEKVIEDYTATRRIAWGDKTTINSDNILNAVKFKTEGAGTVKLLAVGGDPNRRVALYDASGNIISASDGSKTVKNEPLVVEFDIPAAGIYYLGNPDGSNYFHKIILTDYANGEAPAPRAVWENVSAPVINSAEDNGNGKIVVNASALIGHDGGDELLVHMYYNGEKVATKGSVTEKANHTLTFTPGDSGTYSFVAELTRKGESSAKTVSGTNADFIYVLSAPHIESATSKGGGSIEVKWSNVHEAQSYIIYSNGVEIDKVDASKHSYMVTGLTIDQEYSFIVSAVRGNEEKKSSPLSTVASAEAKNEWKFVIYGPSVNEANNGYIGSINDDGKVTVYSEGGKGKIQDSGIHGLSLYYATISTDYNFRLKAKITVDSWTFSNGQEGFGLIALDRVANHLDTSSFFTNQYLAGSTKIEYKYNADTEEILSIKDLNYTSKYTMKLGIGVVSNTGMTKDNIHLFESGNDEKKEFERNYVTTLETRASQLTSISGTYNIIGNHNGALEHEAWPHELITEYVMEIERNNTGYFINYYSADGKTLLGQKKHYDPDALSMLDENNIYVGFFASRNARATFSDVELETWLKADDKTEPETPPTTYITPTISASSTTVTTDRNYELVIDSTFAGTVKVEYDDKRLIDNPIIVENQKIETDGRLKFTFPLLQYGENRIKISYYPDLTAELPEYTELFSKDPIYTTITVLLNYGNYHRKTIYISPDVKPYTTTANGTRENPFDIFTAIESASAGQTLILMEGTYKMNSSLKIQRGMNGTEENPIRLIADPEATTRPVIDFQGLYTGITHGGNYWYFYGFDVTGSLAGQKGFQVSGHYNVLDQIHAYYNGNTGIQISRYAGSDLFPDWPSHNLVLNCTSYCNFDPGFEDADGFAAKLTVGEGNVFDGCVAYNNADDGWDLYAKRDTGAIGSVTIRNCIAYSNGWVPGYDKKGNGNGFKMGGESIEGKHVLENSIAFNNLQKGIDSNSCPDIIIKNSISFNNDSYNVALYTNDKANTAFVANGIISFRTENLTEGDNLKGKGTQVFADYQNDSTYYWDVSSKTAKNVAGVAITADMFVSLEFTGVERNADGSINLNGFLQLKDNVPENVKGAVLGGKASETIVLQPDEQCTFTRQWYNLDKYAHWHMCECGNKADIADHQFITIWDKFVVGNKPGQKHEECEICGYKKAAITVYPEYTPEVEDPDNNDQTQTEELGFFAKIWRAILNFFRRIFGLPKIAYIPFYETKSIYACPVMVARI